METIRIKSENVTIKSLTRGYDPEQTKEIRTPEIPKKDGISVKGRLRKTEEKIIYTIVAIIKGDMPPVGSVVEIDITCLNIKDEVKSTEAQYPVNIEGFYPFTIVRSEKSIDNEQHYVIIGKYKERGTRIFKNSKEGGPKSMSEEKFTAT